MGVWQLVMLFFYVLQIGVDVAKHGQPKSGTHNLITTTIGSAIGIFILYMGGFFNG